MNVRTWTRESTASHAISTRSIVGLRSKVSHAWLKTSCRGGNTRALHTWTAGRVRGRKSTKTVQKHKKRCVTVRATRPFGGRGGYVAASKSYSPGNGDWSVDFGLFSGFSPRIFTHALVIFFWFSASNQPKPWNWASCKSLWTALLSILHAVACTG